MQITDKVILEAADASGFFVKLNKTDLGLNIFFNNFLVEIPREPDQQRDCWWPASLRRQVDSQYDKQGHCILWGLSSTTYATSVSVCKLKKNILFCF